MSAQSPGETKREPPTRAELEALTDRELAVETLMLLVAIRSELRALMRVFSRASRR